MKALIKSLILFGIANQLAESGKCPDPDKKYVGNCSCQDSRPANFDKTVDIRCYGSKSPKDALTKMGNFSENDLFMTLKKINMTVIPANYFRGYFVHVLVIESSPIREIKQYALKGSEKLFLILSLKYTDIRAIPNMSDMERLSTVKIFGAKNFKPEIGPEDMANLPSKVVNSLRLNQLNIKEIKSQTFVSLEDLFLLDLNRNSISSLPNDVFPQSLSILYLRRNKFAELPVDSLMKMKIGARLDFSKNLMKNLKKEEISPLTFIEIEIKIEHETFECSCEMSWLPDYFAEYKTKYLEVYSSYCNGSNPRNSYYIKRMNNGLFDDCQQQ